MSFEDPSKVKIDLVVGEDDADLTESVEASVDEQSQSTSEPESHAHSRPTLSDEVKKNSSLQPWKNRFTRSAKSENTPTTPVQQLQSLPFLLLNYGTFGLAIFNVVTISCALLFSPSEPVFMTGFLLFPIFAVRVLVMINSVKVPGRFVSLGRAVLPIIICNTMTTWGILLALAAVVVAFVFEQVKRLEPLLGHDREKIAMAAFAFCAAGMMQILLIVMLLLSMLIFYKLFVWIARRMQEISGIDFGQKKAGSTGLAAGAIFGLCGLYTSLGMGAENSTQVMNISSLIWSLGILVSSLFFTSISRIQKK